MCSASRRRNILQLLRDRELNDHICAKYALKTKINSKCISKLGLLAELEGHRGCVNCLQWNEKGSTLASASDDFQVILWDPFLQRVKTTIKTSHRGNIFTVKFLPNSFDDIIATGAADWSSHTYNVTTGERLSICTCARARVKRIAVANDTPYIFWTASEDGCIRQYDTRINHDCNFDQTKNTLVSIYGTLGTVIEAKCLDINQLRTEQLAVGANDPYVRLYDRRMIRSLSSFRIKHPFPQNPSELVIKFNDDKKGFKKKINSRPESIVQYFVPGHIYLEESNLNRNKNIGITYLTFSPNGQELLVNYGSEYVYLYDLTHQVESAFCNIPKVMKEPRKNGEGSSTDILDLVPVPHLVLPNEVEQLKLKANYLFEKMDYTAAINLYNDAINMFESSVLFSNRAAAYIKRKWHGDFYAALKDCVTALRLEPNHMKAHFRLTVCLYELKKLDDSKMYLDQFISKYPSYKSSVAFKVLHEDIMLAKAKHDDNETENQFLNSLRAEKKKKNEDAMKYSQAQRMMLEEYLRGQAKDYYRRYYGHCNTSTDIKEANFFGSHSQFIVAGSDDGLFFIWDKSTENNLLILKGDSSIVNCLQPHPSEFMLATSGIDNEIKLWTPLPDDIDNEHVVEHYKKTAMLNQRRMTADSFEVIMRNMRRAVEDDINIERRTDSEYDMLPIPEQFYGCRTS